MIDQCVHPRAIADLMDLVCRNRHDGGYYHQIVDCLMPQLPLLLALNAQGGSACVSTWMTRWMTTLFANVSIVNNCTTREGWEETVPAVVSSRYDGMANALRPFVRDRLQDTIVVIRRLRTRRILEEADLVRALTTCGPVVVFDGTESLRRTVDLFRNARVVVGYHGAGLANIVFSRNGTVLIELTTYVRGTRSWRVNTPSVTKWGSFHSYVIHIPILHILRANNRTCDVADRDHCIKDLPVVTVPDDVRTEVVHHACN